MEIKDITREDDGDVQELVVTLEATADELNSAADSFFAEVNQRDIDGFRKGKAPREVLEREVGGHDQAMGMIVEELVNSTAIPEIDKADIIFLETPDVNVETLPVLGEPFTFTVSGQVQPELDLSSVEPVQFTMPPEKATDAEIEQQIVDLQHYYHQLVKIDDESHEAQPGDYAEMKLTVLDNETGRPISRILNVNRMIALGEGAMPESFDEHIYGTKVGDQLEFDFDAHNEEGDSDFGSGDLHAQAEILGFRECIVPELNDEFAQKVGCVDVDDLRKQMRLNINQTKGEELPKLMVDKAIDELLERVPEIPEYYVDFVRQTVGHETVQKMQDQGVDLQQWMLQNAVGSEEMKEGIQNESIRRAKIDVALDSLFRQLGLQIDEDDINDVFEGADEDARTREEWEEANRMAEVRRMARRAKATRWLVDNADVTIEGE